MIVKPSLSFPDLLVREDGQITGKRGHVLSQCRDKKGYWGIPRRVAGTPKPVRVQTHFLVCEAFHGPRPEGMLTRHLDGNQENNHFSNLKWGTPLENHLDAVRHGTANLKLTGEQVQEIRQLAQEGKVPQRVIAADYGISQQHVSALKLGIHWTWLDEAEITAAA